MVAFYIWPVLAIGLVVTARAGRFRFASGVVVAVGTTVVAQWHLGELPWWSITTAGLLVLLAVGIRRERTQVPSEPSGLSVVTRSREPPRVLVGSASA
jgi:hypothetical protein